MDKDAVQGSNLTMDFGQLLTRLTVWLALVLYVIGEVVRTYARPREATLSWSVNAIGCVFFLGHVLCAFHFFHDWSHAVAYADTARQTKEFSGWNSGAGIYLNYFFALVWAGEVIWAWLNPRGYSARAAWISWAVRMFFLFMIFNGAFVFVRGHARWLGLLLCGVLAVCWWLPPKRTIAPPHPSKLS